ncbi:MAG TPA: hypothetical protein VEY95_03305 [Azospirillaceae bacterium]|nr:hypothetical protein [Azospirillaceae bacterium]
MSPPREPLDRSIGALGAAAGGLLAADDWAAGWVAVVEDGDGEAGDRAAAAGGAGMLVKAVGAGTAGQGASLPLSGTDRGKWSGA